jgi:hypothetical protein
MKLMGSQLLKKFPEFYETRRIITAFTRTLHLTEVVSFPQVHPLKPYMHLYTPPYVLHALTILVVLT